MLVKGVAYGHSTQTSRFNLNLLEFNYMQGSYQKIVRWSVSKFFPVDWMPFSPPKHNKKTSEMKQLLLLFFLTQSVHFYFYKQNFLGF